MAARAAQLTRVLVRCDVCGYHRRRCIPDRCPVCLSHRDHFKRGSSPGMIANEEGEEE
jgi:rubrerythrin